MRPYRLTIIPTFPIHSRPPARRIFLCLAKCERSPPMTTDTTEPKRAIQTTLESARPFPGHYRRTLGSAHRPRIEVPACRKWPCGDCRASWSPAWITDAKSALGRHEARDSSWLIDWQERDGRCLRDLSKNPCAEILWKPASVSRCQTNPCSVHWAAILTGRAAS